MTKHTFVVECVKNVPPSGTFKAHFGAHLKHIFGPLRGYPAWSSVGPVSSSEEPDRAGGSDEL
jgi:hypothetical protein